MNLVAHQMNDAWLEGSTEDCDEIATRLAEHLGVSRHKLFLAFTNLACFVDTFDDSNQIRGAL